jgi:hypothetical protein
LNLFPQTKSQTQSSILLELNDPSPSHNPKTMPTKKQILNTIAAVSQDLGRTPSRAEFVSRSGVSFHHVLQWFPSWRDALRTAGLRPYSLNLKLDERAMLEDWGKVVRKNREILNNRARLPRYIYRRQGKFNPHTLANRFGGWCSVPRAFCNFARDNRDWADVVALINSHTARGPSSALSSSERSRWPTFSLKSKPSHHTPRKGLPTYGNPINFAGLRHEPLNEQGVVLLFGMLANDLGYMIESVQNGFPDCEALRRVGSDRWQRVRIEFEYESRNFREHGHPPTGCDVIVCWRHNWQECPPNIEVLQLRSLIHQP